MEKKFTVEATSTLTRSYIWCWQAPPPSQMFSFLQSICTRNIHYLFVHSNIPFKICFVFYQCLKVSKTESPVETVAISPHFADTRKTMFQILQYIRTNNIFCKNSKPLYQWSESGQTTLDVIKMMCFKHILICYRNSFGAIVKLSQHPRKTPKLNKVTILIKSMLQCYNFLVL